MTGSSGSVENVTFEDFSDQTKDDTGNLKREISSTGISEDILCYNCKKHYYLLFGTTIKGYLDF